MKDIILVDTAQFSTEIQRAKALRQRRQKRTASGRLVETCSAPRNRRERWLLAKAGYFRAIREAAGACFACGDDERLTVHHITPLREGGTNDLLNLRVLCADCHKQVHES